VVSCLDKAHLRLALVTAFGIAYLRFVACRSSSLWQTKGRLRQSKAGLRQTKGRLRQSKARLRQTKGGLRCACRQSHCSLSIPAVWGMPFVRLSLTSSLHVYYVITIFNMQLCNNYFLLSSLFLTPLFIIQCFHHMMFVWLHNIRVSN